VAAQQVSDLTLALVAGGFMSFGVLAKMAYDSVVARRAAKRENLTWLAEERRAAYEAFLDAVEHEREHEKKLRGLLARAQAGETEMSDEEQAAFPKSALPDMVRAVERIRRLARNYSVITTAEAIIQLLATWPEHPERHSNNLVPTIRSCTFSYSGFRRTDYTVHLRLPRGSGAWTTHWRTQEVADRRA
jgi:hypothetical protein